MAPAWLFSHQLMIEAKINGEKKTRTKQTPWSNRNLTDKLKKLSEQMKENRKKIFTIHKLKPNKRIRDT